MTSKKTINHPEHLINCVKLGIIILNEEGVVTRANSIACDLIGLEKLNGRALESVIPSLTIENMHRMMIQNTCNTIELNHRRIQLQTQQIPLRHERIEMLLFMMDVTAIEFMVRDFNELQRSQLDYNANTNVENQNDDFELMDIREAVSLTEIKLIKKAYDQYGNVRDAAKALGIDASTFVRKRNKYEKLGMLDGF